MPVFGVVTPSKLVLTVITTPTDDKGLIYHGTVRNNMGATCLVESENTVFCDKISSLKALSIY